MKTLEKSKFQMAGNIAVNFTPSSSLGFFRKFEFPYGIL